MERSDYIYGIRAVIEAIKSGKEIDKILISKNLSGDLIGELNDLIRENRIFSRRVPPEKIDKITRRNHQGVIAILAAVSYTPLGIIVPELFEQGKSPLIVLLDGVTDVRNFGAIARTCECAGVDALVIPEIGSVSAGADAMKTSAGALNYLPVCREHTIATAVRYLRNSGFKIVAASEKAKISYTQADYTEPTAIVMGAEDVGISPETLKLCDTLVAIPERGHISSLNVAVAAGIIIYRAVTQRIEAAD